MSKVDENVQSNEVLNYLKDFDGIEFKTIDLLVNNYGFKTFNTLLSVKDEDIFEKNLFELNLSQKFVLREVINQVKSGLISMIIPSKVIKQEVNDVIENTDDSEIEDNICQNIVMNKIDFNSTQISIQTNELENNCNLETNEVFNYLKNFNDIKEKTIEVLINKYEFSSKESLAFIEENDIKDFVELSFGQRLVLKKIIKQLKTELESTDSSTKVINTETEREVIDSVNYWKCWTIDDNEIIECQTNTEIAVEDELQRDEEMTEDVMPDIEEGIICDNNKDSKLLEKFGIKESKVVLNDISVDMMPNDSNGKKVQFKCLSNNLTSNSIEKKSLPSSSASYSNHSNDNYVTNNQRWSVKQTFLREKSNAFSGKRRKRRSLENQWKRLTINQKNEYKIKALIGNRTSSFTDNRETYRCKACKKSFDQYFKCISHMVFEHKRGKWFECSICGNRYTTPSTLIDHIRGIHENRKDFECKKCVKWFRSRRGLIHHLKKC